MGSATTISQTQAHHSGPMVARLGRDYAELFKLRINAMVVITGWTGFFMASQRSGISSLNAGLWQTLLGIAMTSFGASALNQVLERVIDSRMQRTATRPVATGRIGLAHASLLGMSLVIAGTLLLAVTTNLLTATLALLTVVLYVAIYTPLKRFTTLNTFIGAIPGALPPLIGWTAARSAIEWPALALFAILFLWQFPHFMAIAWMYRHDYARGGLRMIPVADPSGVSTVTHALFYAAILVPASLLPFWLQMAGWGYAIAALVVTAAYLAASIQFARILSAPDENTSLRYARILLRTSIVVLPALLIAMVANSIAR